MAMTNIRRKKKTTIAVAQQTAYGSAAATSNVLRLQATNVRVNPGYQSAHPDGTTGSTIRKDTHYKTGEKPSVHLEMPCTKKNLIFFASHCIGLTAATTAGSEISLAGNDEFTTMTLVNVLPHLNTDDAWKLYVSITDGGSGTGHTVDIYRDSGRGAGDKVATGSGDDSATVTLSEANDSGLSGTFTFGTITGNDTDAVATIAEVDITPDHTITEYFTFWRDNEHKLERVIDCAVNRLIRRSQEAGIVMLEVDAVGSTHEPDLSTVFTASSPTSDDKDVYLHKEVNYNSDVDSGDVAESVFSVVIEIDRDVAVDLANSDTATSIWHRMFNRLQMTVEQRFTDESHTVAMEGFNDAWTSEQCQDVHDSKNATWLWDKCKVVEPSLPDQGETEYERHVHTIMCVEESAASPSTALTLTVQGP